ncbi:YbbR domain-containing protein [Paenibacillus sp. UNC496MF]|uniref:CdaR family protein n=1 Tax=Paenibacillus sp. UNC496MF TaxID=1502753 RepID=UPI0008E8DDCE|nr:CdaR family protein [Paenibacillus sp. UNC496MF]SFJ92111.1 YbbR domain-containing protein [Paenibacillus sp. UNC496MF]
MDKWLNHPTALKIISLVIGILMWAVVHFDSEKTPNTVATLTETRDIDGVQIKPVGMDDKNYALRLLDPEGVHLTVRGSRSDLLLASHNSDYEVTVDLSQATEGRMVLPVKVHLPRGLELIDAQPSSVTVVLERLLTKEFEVQINAEGTPGKGYKIGTPLVKPNGRVHVTLPADEMDEVAFVGGTVSVDGEEETVNDKKMKLVALDKDGNELPDAVMNPSVVEVEIPITKPFKKLPLQVNFTGNLPEGLAMSTFKQSVDAVTIYGPQDVIDKYEFYDALTIDLSQLKQSGTMELDVKPGKDVASVDPAKVTFEYTIVTAQTKLIPKLPVTIIGLSDGLKAKVTLPETESVDATIAGAPNMLAQVGAKDVQLVADLSGLGPGSHVVPLDMHVPRFIGQAGAPLSVTVTITDGTVAPPGGAQTDGSTPASGQPATDTGTEANADPSAGPGNAASGGANDTGKDAPADTPPPDSNAGDGTGNAAQEVTPDEKPANGNP